jgi:hypothetical protein
MLIKSDKREEVIRDFVERVAQATRETPLTVFVCGPAVFTNKGTKSRRRGARIRDFVSKKIAERGSAVFWGEHRRLRNAGRGISLQSFTDADREVHFAANSADLILIFPDSAGSLAELGGFSLHEHIAPKMLVVFDASRRFGRGFVIKAVARAAKSRKAQVKFKDYSQKADVWTLVEQALTKIQTVKLTSKSYASSRA